MALIIICASPMIAFLFSIGSELLPLGLAAAFSSPFISPLPDENDGMRCHSFQMSSDVSSALFAVNSFLSTPTKSIISLLSTKLLVESL